MKNLFTLIFAVGFLFLFATETSSAQCDCGQLRTQTIGGWGANPSGNNPGQFLKSNFDDCFPQGVTLSASCGTEITFTSAQAITDYLPAGGSPKAVNGDYIDPSTSDLKNTFVSQLTAITISLGFDDCMGDFGPAQVRLASATLNEGALAGKSVSEIYDIALEALLCGEGDYSINDLNSAISSINENYVDGEENLGMLECDCGSEPPVSEPPLSLPSDSLLMGRF